MSLEFIGVYATKEKVALGSGLPPILRKRSWFVWSTPEGAYTIQALNAASLPMSAPRDITAAEFKTRFTREEGCDVVPAGYEKTSGSESWGEMSLPDLFNAMRGSDAPLESVSEPAPAPEAPSSLAADAPNLLELWLQDEPPAPEDTEAAVAEMPHNSPAGEEEGPGSEVCGEQQEQFLRSQFVQALLLLKRGARDESIALLRDLLTRPYQPFEGAASLFSEYGLNLRRLGLVSLAVLAHGRALEFAPRDARILFNIARSHHDLGHVSEARKYLEKALAVAPDFAQARQFLDLLAVRETER